MCQDTQVESSTISSEISWGGLKGQAVTEGEETFFLSLHQSQKFEYPQGPEHLVDSAYGILDVDIVIFTVCSDICE